MSAAIDSLTPDWKLIILGVPGDDLHVTARLLLSGRSIQGSAGRTPIEAEDAMAWRALGRQARH